MLALSYQLVRSRRKTLALSLSADGVLTARAPMHMPVSSIEAFIRSKRGWIARKREELRLRQSTRNELSLTEGARLPYLGGELIVCLTDSPRLSLAGNRLTLPRDATSEAFRCWLKAQAAVVFPDYVEPLARRMGLRVHSLHVSTAKTRWGSMTSGRDMRLNAALLLAPLEIIEYVIVHELAHIPHPDHSAAFWALVGQVLPDYQARRLWLRRHDTLAAIPKEGV